MTEQKKKAKELIERFSPHARYWDCYNDEPLEEDHAKLSAILCVDEILKEIYSNKVITNDKRRIFWQQVKEDIINYKN